MFQVLSLDGGGIRGAFTAAVIDEIEKRLQRPVRECFDLIAGTSTGAIVAAGLARGESGAKIVQFYRTHGPKIFTRPKRNRSFAGWICSVVLNRKLKKLGIDDSWLFSSKFDSDHLRSALMSVFMNDTLETIESSALVIPSFDLVKGQPVVFKTPHFPNFVRDRNFKIVDILLATTAAPTYFPAASIDPGTKYVDGGVWANNPTMVAVAEAAKLIRSSNESVSTCASNVPSTMRVLSVGTGNPQSYLQPPEGSDGILWWLAGRLVDVMMLSQSQGIHYQAQYLLGESYNRLNFNLPSVEWRLDNTEVIEQLIHLGRETAKSNLAIIDSIAEREALTFQRY